MLETRSGAPERGKWLPRVAAAGLVDKRFGPVLEFSCQRLGGNEPPWFLATTAVARHPIGALHNEVALSSAGTSLSAEEAESRAIGEAIERYSALNAAASFELLFERATLREGGLADRWPVCAPDEPCSPLFRSLARDVPLTQVRMRRLGDNASVLAPAGFVFLGFHPLPPEPPVTLPISTGLAFHPERHQAIWRGLSEVLERDAVMTAWWLHRRLPEIDMTDAPYGVTSRLEHLAAAGMTARLYDITTELGVPTAFALLQSPRYPHLVVGAASRATADAAAAKALDEVVSMRVALQVDAPTAREPGAAPPATLVAHARWHAGGNRDGAFDFLLASGLAAIPYRRFAERSIAEPADMAALDRLAQRFGIEELPILWVELTAPEMRALGSVVRVVVPGLVPLSPDDRIRWLGTTRLLRRAGLAAASRGGFARHPHPFA